MAQRLIAWVWGPAVPSVQPPFPHPHTIDAALANAFEGDESTEAFLLRLDAAQEELPWTSRS